MGGQLGFMYRQLTFKPKPIPSSTRLDNKVAIITGANAGLGLETSREFISHGLAHLIIAVRDESKGEAARAELLRNVSNDSCRIEVWKVDQADLNGIVAFSERVETLPRLDIVILNAGVKYLNYEKSPSNHEMNVQVNHIGTSLVSLLLIPKLQASARKINAPARLTLVGSEGQFWCSFKEHSAPNVIERLDEQAAFPPAMERYYTTKLMTQLWTAELASRVTSDEVVITTVNPGLCASSLHRHDSSGALNFFLKIFAWTSEQGGHCLAHAATHGTSYVHGAYFSEQKKTEPCSFSTSSQGIKAQKKLWNETIDLLKKECPRASLTQFDKP
ncbi:dehydrogenase [Periconia macrospinosa]|uniref:Dehydrogenase n=1 Tax=Periconia macrospinosa TaxID=97972 RepID=A0A2V1DEA6_9PLEO|nr:dehydrogenase [Periconia macrospinosa]